MKSARRINTRRIITRWFAFLALLACLTSAPGPVNAVERCVPFNEGWKFARGEQPGAEQPNFDDDHWATVRLPHDWAIEGPFDPTLNPHIGALPISGIGWYRKSFITPVITANHNDPSKRSYSIEFDGAMANSRVWLNGHELGGRPSGYIGFGFDLTPDLAPSGKRNELVVRLAPEIDSSRWYPGAGIYRNVWLVVTGDLHVARWGTYVTTPVVTDTLATVAIRVALRNRRATHADITIRSIVQGADGVEVARSDVPATLEPGTETLVRAQLDISHPQRWDVERPYLYSLITEVHQGERTVDRYLTHFGVRTIRFTPEGFELNGRRLKLHGVCLHHDLGALGAAVNRRATERQLEIMKAAGVNALRTSHNPPSPELLEYADKLGLLVIDESFDAWKLPKASNDYSKYFAQWSERDVRDQVRRDRNHPSVIMWSIGNEIPEQEQADGWKEARRLTAFFHEEDPTRPTTSAFNLWEAAISNKMADEVDIPGLNYAPTHYAELLKNHPAWIVYGSETASCVSSRGTYHLPIEKYTKHGSLQISSYDIVAPPWAYCPDVEFAAQEANPAILGEFVWTGFDYLGEPTPYFGWNEDNSRDWPARSSYFGMVDLAGFPKDRYYLYQSVWTTQPMVHVLPHWNWPGYVGERIPVMVYSNADEVELWLNGRSQGRNKPRAQSVEIPVGPNIDPSLKFTSQYRLLWNVPYQPGVLKAVAYRAGKVVAQETVRTAGAPARIRLMADRDVITGDGDDLSFITVRIEDQAGNLCPRADNLVTFKITGAGQLEAVDNGNAATTESFHANFRKAFNGLALLIVRSRSGAVGPINISAIAEGLAPSHLKVIAQSQARSRHVRKIS